MKKTSFLLLILFLSSTVLTAQMDKRISVGVYSGVRDWLTVYYLNDKAQIYTTPWSTIRKNYPQREAYNACELSLNFPIIRGLWAEIGMRYTILKRMHYWPVGGPVIYSDHVISESIRLQYAFFNRHKYKLVTGLRYEHMRSFPGYGINLGVYHAFSKHHGVSINMEFNLRHDKTYKDITGTGLSLNYYFLGTKWFWQYDKATKQ